MALFTCFEYFEYFVIVTCSFLKSPIQDHCLYIYIYLWRGGVGFWVGFFCLYVWGEKLFVVSFTSSKKRGNRSSDWKLKWKIHHAAKRALNNIFQTNSKKGKQVCYFLSDPQPWTSVPKYSGSRLPAEEGLEVKGLTFLKKLYLAKKDFGSKAHWGMDKVSAQSRNWCQ